MAMLSPWCGPGNISVPVRVAARCAKCRGGYLGLCNAPPAIIGARVPEAYVAIMERSGTD